MTKQPLPPPVDTRSDEALTLDPALILRFFRSNWVRIATIAAGFALVGVVSSLLAVPEYTSETRLLPELKSSLAGKFGQFSSLAALAGVNLDNAGGDAEAVRPDLYPNILQSTPFLLYVMGQKVTDPDFAQPVRIEEYLWEKEDHTPQGKISGLFGLRHLIEGRSSSGSVPDAGNVSKAVRLSRRQEKLLERLKKRISSGLDKKTGIITISVEMPDPVVAATVTRLTTEYLTTYVVSYRTEKSRQQALFLRQRVAEAKRRYQAAEYALQSYKDRNRNPFLNVARIDEQRLQSEYTLAQSVYNELSRQLEQANVKVQEETPIFKVLDPPQVPNLRSSPKRTQMVILFALLGAIVGIAWAYLRPAKPKIAAG